jgi:hypothetical protein
MLRLGVINFISCMEEISLALLHVLCVVLSVFFSSAWSPLVVLLLLPSCCLWCLELGGFKVIIENIR